MAVTEYAHWQERAIFIAVLASWERVDCSWRTSLEDFTPEVLLQARLPKAGTMLGLCCSTVLNANTSDLLR